VVDPAAVSAATSTVAAATATITACSAACAPGSTASAITVTARDAFGNLVPNAAVVVAASGTGNGFNPTASGNADGTGVFTTAFNSTVAEAKTISATAGGTGITQTAGVTVTPAGAAELVFTTQPTGGSVISPITPAMVVTVRDAFGNTVTGFAGTVTMTIENDASLLANAVLTGTNPVAVVNGTATFSDLQLDQVGNGYTLRATAGSLFIISAGFNVGLVI